MIDWKSCGDQTIGGVTICSFSEAKSNKAVFRRFQMALGCQLLTREGKSRSSVRKKDIRVPELPAVYFHLQTESSSAFLLVFKAYSYPYYGTVHFEAKPSKTLPSLGTGGIKLTARDTI